MAVKPRQTSESPLSAEKLERSGVFVLGLVLVSLPLFFWIKTYEQFELPKLMLLRLLSVGLIGIFVTRQALSASWAFRRTPLDLPVLLWSLWLAFKTLHSVSPAVSWRGEYENFAGTLTQLNYSLLFYLSVQMVRSLASARRLLIAFELSAVAVGMYAIFQALHLDFIVWDYYSSRFFSTMGNPNFLGALMIMALALVAARWAWRGDAPRLKALWAWWSLLLVLPLGWLGLYLFSPPGHVLKFGELGATARSGALWIMAAYFLGIFMIPLLLRQGHLRLSESLLLFLEAMVLFKALSDTGTRGAFAGQLAVVAFYALLSLRRQWVKLAAAHVSSSRRWMLLAGAGLAILAGLATLSLALGPELRRRMSDTLAHPLQAFDESRLQIWIPALKIARDFPLTGSGVDTFKTVFPQYAYTKFAKYEGENAISRMAHCEPLQVLSTMGLVGLGLWLWMLARWFYEWQRLWREDSGADWEKSGTLAALAALAVGYLVQNLVSFGVSAISAPFFMALGLLWSGSDLKKWSRPARAGGKALLLLLLGPWLAWGAWAATVTFRADTLLKSGHMVFTQRSHLKRSSLAEARSASAYALTRLRESAARLKAEQRDEANFWSKKLGAAEAEIRATPGDASRPLPLYRKAAHSLLLTLSTVLQQEAVQLAPREAMYHVSLGLAYEELSKRSESPERRSRWLELAEASYSQATRLNPRNAYYHGNLGRLYALRAEAGQMQYVARAEEKYRDAVRLGPVTRLFYENLLLLYAQSARGEAAFPVLEPLEGRDPHLAGQLYFSAATIFYQAGNAFNDGKEKEKAASLKAACLKALEKARLLDPKNADIPFSQGVIAFYDSDLKAAKQYLSEALAINPSHEPTLSFRTMKNLF